MNTHSFNKHTWVHFNDIVLCEGNKENRAPAVFACRHYVVLKFPVSSTQPTVYVSRPALYWRYQPVPFHAFHFCLCHFSPSHNQVAEPLCLP